MSADQIVANLSIEAPGAVNVRMIALGLTGPAVLIELDKEAARDGVLHLNIDAGGFPGDTEAELRERVADMVELALTTLRDGTDREGGETR